MALNFHFFYAVNVNISLRASTEYIVESFNISSLYISSKPFDASKVLATALLSMFLKEQTHFSVIDFCHVYGTSVKILFCF